VLSAEVHRAFFEIGATSADVTFGLAVLRGIFAGWLIAFIVWLLPLAESGRLPVIVGVTWLVGLGGFTHIIAGSIEVLYMVSLGALPCINAWADTWRRRSSVTFWAECRWWRR
jgi:formate-nitrite transporter family protein